MSNEKLKIELKIRTMRQELNMLKDSIDLLARELKAIEEEADAMIEISALTQYLTLYAQKKELEGVQ